MAHASRSPRPWNALLLGLTLGLAYLAHPTGALMICLVPVAQAIADHENDVRTTWLRRGAVLLLAGVGLTAVLLIVPRLLRSGGAAVDVGAAAAIVRAFSTHGFSLLRLPEVFLDEWLVPFFAASVLALLAARFRDARPLVGFLLLGLLPYVIGAQLMLSDYSERGAYLLPVAWPTAALAVHALRRKEALTWFAIAFTAVTAIVQVELHDHPARPRAYAEGLRAIAGESGFQLLAGHELDVEAWLVAFEEAPVVYLGQFVDQDEAGIAVTLRHLDEWILSNHVRGRSTFLSDLGMQSIREAARRGEWPLSHDPELWVGARAADEILTHLESHYALLPVHQAGFSGYRLLPRR